jgi:mannose-6-phosphate isomerase
VAALLNSRTLQPGEAVFVDPGTVHAYVRGTGVEVMVNSDNVLRLGLTTKTIAVDAALTALSTKAQPHSLRPPVEHGVAAYVPAGAPFRVDVVTDAGHAADMGLARIIVCLNGQATIGQTVLMPGEGCCWVRRTPAWWSMWPARPWWRTTSAPRRAG